MPAFAEEAVVVERGVEGLAAVPFQVANRTDRSISCSAAIAHWYSADIGVAEPGGRLEAGLWSKPATGEVFLLNDRQDRMPVQRLWCGYAGADVSTRSEIGLVRRAGSAEPALDLVCLSAGRAQPLDCRRRGSD
ncbi:hypothetical protein J2X65_000723 [Ancylobacter sp. 3268]|uniref:hypothetical protein n=1 Tax=Ancylobacter sp. 3268 TaxID=2817752 RepID=UPI00285734B0|nr:hypothetical protein [Ancylobacter sp. 3268]MDR6951375.1 hypothetical protein [Ancylobacter sp. 3268]